MKKIYSLLLPLLCLINTITTDDGNSPTNVKATTDTTKPISETVVTEAPVDILSRPLCKKCACDADSKTINCAAINLTSFLTDEELNDLVNANIKFETLNLERNSIESVPKLPALPIKKLILKNNNITQLAKAVFKELPNLEVLDLSFNQLESTALLPAVFEGHYNSDSYLPLGTLRELNLGYNLLHTLDSDIFEHVNNLEWLILTENPLLIIDKNTEIAITSLLNLKVLDLKDCQLRDLPEHLLHTPKKLEKLILTGNLLKTIPDALTYATNLRSLYLDENPIGDIDGKNVFPEMKALEELSISYMPDIKIIGKGAFSGLSNLKVLMASNNLHLEDIHPNAFSLPKKQEIDQEYPPMEKMYLQNNNLTVLYRTLLERWDKLTLIDIRKNPWKCDCDNSFLIHDLFAQIKSTTPTISNHIRCGSPSEWHDKEMDEIYEKKSSLRCPDYYGNHPENDGPILIGMIIGLLVGIPFTFVLIIIYKRGCFGLRNVPDRLGSAHYKRASLRDDVL